MRANKNVGVTITCADGFKGYEKYIVKKTVCCQYPEIFCRGLCLHFNISNETEPYIKGSFILWIHLAYSELHFSHMASNN